MSPEEKVQAIKFLEETIDFYSLAPDKLRSVIPGKGSDGGYVPRCVYQTRSGKKCAIGRKLVKYSSSFENHNVDSLVKEHTRLILSEDIRYLPAEFLDSIQRLHDTDLCWNRDRGLSPKGVAAVIRIINNWELDL